MIIILIILNFAIFALLIIASAVRLERSKLSLFELERRTVEGDKQAKKILERQNLLNDVESLQKAISALLIVLLTILLIISFGPFLGAILIIFVAIEYNAIARILAIRNFANKMYSKIDNRLIAWAKNMPIIFRLIRVAPADNYDAQLNSRQELQHLIDKSEGVLTADEKSLIVNGLSFGDKLVSSIMTPKSMIDSIKNTEFLGPLTLDDLHKTGHSRLPVIKGDIDHIIGLLNIKGLLNLDIKRSSTAEKAMDPKVYYIREDQTLQYALTAFIKTKHHLFVVINEFRETVGLLSLEDVIEQLLGHKIIDEFDAHDDLRAVALRNIHNNNHSKQGKDV